MAELWRLLPELEPHSLLWIFVIAVVIAPWVFRVQTRVRRLLRSLSLIMLGLVIGQVTCGFY